MPSSTPASDVDAIIAERGLKVVSDTGALGAAADDAIAANPDVAEKVRGGKVAAVGPLVGAVMKATRGQADAASGPHDSCWSGSASADGDVMWLRALLAGACVLAVALPAAARHRRCCSTSIDPRITEASGIAIGIASPGVVYVQNDSGDSARFFALDTRTGKTLATYTVPGAANVDWEDLAVARDRRGVAVDLDRRHRRQRR